MFVTVHACMPQMPLLSLCIWFSFFLFFFPFIYFGIMSLQLQDAVVSFPLYNEALKFARHGEKMIQTAVRALTLNIYNGIVSLSFSIFSK